MAGPVELKVSIGQDVVGLRCLDPVSSAVVREWCAEFRTSRAADFWLAIKLEPGRTPIEVQAIWPALRVVADSGRLHTSPPLFEVQLSIVERTLCFRSEEALFHPSITPRFLNILLSYAYNTIWDSAPRGSGGSFLFHGCGVATGGRGLPVHRAVREGQNDGRSAGRGHVWSSTMRLFSLQEREGGALWMCGTPLLGGVNQPFKHLAPCHAPY